MFDSDADRIKYFYDELVMTLITFSMPAEKQIEMMGNIGCPGCEMTADFETYYVLSRQNYARYRILSDYQIKRLDEFNEKLDEEVGMVPEEFWCNPDSLKTHPRWDEFRTHARACLEALGKANVGIEVVHEQIEGGERTIRKLVPKDRTE